MSLPATMRALVQTSLDGPKDLRLVTDAAVPRPGPHDVLVRVAAAGLNFLDVSQSRGASFPAPRPPYVAGVEGAGEVVAVGDAVGDAVGNDGGGAVPAVRPGARVIGACIGGGAFAEYMAMPAAGATPLPDGWADEQALGMAVSWPAALAALKPVGGVRAGQTVLISAAAGGTGQAAVRMARHYGAAVFATASPEKHDAVRALGVEHVIDARTADVAAEVRRLTGGAGVDLVLESAGGPALEAALASAKRVTGRVVVYGLAGGEATISNWDLVYRHQVQVVGMNVGALIQSAPTVFGEVMTELRGLIASGALEPGRPAVHELADGPGALAALESRATIGRLALRP